jgi:hypothetical protein
MTQEQRPTLPSSARTVFFVSDGTGITAETFGHSVLTQFELRFRQVRLPFIDTLDKAHDAVRKINEAFATDGQRPIIFSTLVKTEFPAGSWACGPRSAGRWLPGRCRRTACSRSR